MSTYNAQAIEDYEWVIGITRLGMKCCGIWPNRQQLHWQKLLINTQVIIMALWVINFAVIPCLISLIKVWGDMTLIIDNLIIIFPFSAAIIKLVIVWYNEDDLTDLFNEVYDDWVKTKTIIDRKIMVKHGKIARIVTIFSYILVTWVVFSHHTPFWITGRIPRTHSNITDGDRALTFPSVYFYDLTNDKIFKFTGMAQTICSIFAGYSYTTVDCMFATLILHVCGQLQLLKLHVEIICDNYHDKIRVDPMNFIKILKINVQVHQKLMRFIGKMEKIFSIMLLIQFLAFGIIFATEGFHLISIFVGDVEGSLSTMSFAISYFLCTLSLIFLYSAAGELLITNSHAIHSAVYNSQWFDLKSKDMSQLILVIARAQKPLVITVGKFAPLSFNTFSALIKTSGSYISMLLAVKS